MPPRDFARPFSARPRARAGLPAGIASIVAALGGLVAASSDGPGQAAGVAMAFLGVLGAILTAGARSDASAAGVETLEEALSRELDRARRHRHSLALVRIGTPSAPGRMGGDKHPRPAQAPGAVRAVDRLWVYDDGIVALLPETDRDGAEHAALRVLGAAGMVDPELTIAAFPGDGLTTGALLARLHDGRAPTAMTVRRVDVADAEAVDDTTDSTAV